MNGWFRTGSTQSSVMNKGPLALRALQGAAAAAAASVGIGTEGLLLQATSRAAAPKLIAMPGCASAR